MQNDFLQKKIKEELGTPTLHLIFGKFYLVKNDLDKAIMEYKKAIKMNSKHPKAHYFLAEVYLKIATKRIKLSNEEKQQLLEKAALHFNKTVALSPESKEAQDAKDRLKNFKNILK